MKRLRIYDICLPKETFRWTSENSKDEYFYIDLSSVDRESRRISDPILINESNAPSRAKQKIRFGDILFATTRPLLKRSCIVPEEYDGHICSTGFCLVRPNTTVVLSSWLHYCLCSQRFYDYIEPLQKGISYPAVSDKEVYDYKIFLPTLEIQKSIASELDAIQTIINSYKEQISDLNELAKSTFFVMFGDPIVNDKGWDLCNVIDVVKFQRGFDLPIQSREGNGNIPIYGSNGIIGRHNESMVTFGIITGRSGTLGEVYACDEPFWPLNTTLFSIDTHGNNIVFLKYLMTYYHLERFKSGSGVPTLNRNNFHNKAIPKIPFTLQEEFANKIKHIELQQSLIIEQLKDAEQLMAERMQYYFS